MYAHPNSLPARCLRFVALCVASLAMACAPVRSVVFTDAPADSDPELLIAHQAAEAAFSECRSTYVEDHTPWQAPLAGGLAGLSALTAAIMFVGPFATEAWVPTSAQGNTNAIATALFGSVLVGSTIAAVYFGAQLPEIYGSNSARSDVLLDAASRGEQYVSRKDVDGLKRLATEIFEDCRIVRASNDAEAAHVVLRDIARYRKLEQQHTEEKAALDGARQELVAKTRTLENDLQTQSSDMQVLSEKQRLQQEQMGSLQGRVQEKASENSALQLELDKLAQDKAQLEATKAQLLREKERADAEAKKYQSVADALENEVKKGRLDVRRLKNGVVVELRNRVLFPSGSAELNPLGKKTLEAVSVAIRDLKGQRIRVEGHTDNIPVSSNGDYPSNWDLSSARALAVTKFLQEAGVPPNRLSAEARGEFAPKASNKSSKGRALNRRIEIFLVPEQDGKSAKWKK